MNITFDRFINGFQFTGLAEIEHGEEATEIDPSWPTIVTVSELQIDGSHRDYFEIIDPAIIQRLEKMIAEDL